MEADPMVNISRSAWGDRQRWSQLFTSSPLTGSQQQELCSKADMKGAKKESWNIVQRRWVEWDGFAFGGSEGRGALQQEDIAIR